MKKMLNAINGECGCGKSHSFIEHINSFETSTNWITLTVRLAL
jgi:hypothetical protein